MPKIVIKYKWRNYTINYNIIVKFSRAVEHKLNLIKPY